MPATVSVSFACGDLSWICNSLSCHKWQGGLLEISFLESYISGFREIDVYSGRGWQVVIGYKEPAAAAVAGTAVVAVDVTLELY